MPSFIRRIEIAVHGNLNSAVAKSSLEDDYHHFRVALALNSGKVSDVRTAGLRTPYTLCGQAGSELAALIGLDAHEIVETLPQKVDARLQCTHQLDMAGLIASTAIRNEARCRFSLEVPRHLEDCTTATLWRNDEKFLHWRIENNVIVSPGRFNGVSLLKGMAAWARQTLDEESAEASLILRRGALISRGRLRNLDIEPHAKPLGNCYVQQPARASTAQRVIGSTLDFTATPNALCASDSDWLRSPEFSV